ncbi:MAG: tetratricopeptide repeat protein [Rhodanobacteraceae bacterium]|nr:MAG: tetratricopeptide repeat protein [Rhodanobacteraceae bacterium]
MNTQAGEADQSQITLARAYAAQQRIGEAEAAYRNVLRTAPDTPEALNFVAMCALSRRDFAPAQRDLERAAELNPGEPEIWKNFGIMYLAQKQGFSALHAFDRALDLQPAHFAARLLRGNALEQMGRIDEAAKAYFGAIAAAQSSGEWLDDRTTAPALRPAVRHAINVVDTHRARIFMALLEPLHEKHGAHALRRIVAGLEIYLDHRPAHYPPHQYCKFFYVPDLPNPLYYDRSLFPWYAEVEAHTDEIRAELLAVMRDPDGVEPFLGTNDNDVLAEQKLLNGTRGHAEWNSFFFHRHGKRYAKNANRCPRTMELLDKTSVEYIRDHAPEALFSILSPGAHILKHHGVTNARLVTHLPLIVPDDTAISVAGEDYHWQEGRFISFDDTYLHESWNDSTKVRANLMFDVWHPDLSAAEREAMALLVGGIGDFNKAAGVGAPPAS